MDTYRRVKQQIAELERKAAGLRRAEAAKVIADIKKKIAKFELQPEDLFDSVAAPKAASPVKRAAAGRAKSASKSASKSAAKYRDPVSGKTWTGHGKAPNWIKGKDREAFLIDAPAANTGMPAKPVAPVKKTAKPARKAAPVKAVRKAPVKAAVKAAGKPVAKKRAGAVKKTTPLAAAPVAAEGGVAAGSESPAS